ncbi:unnamed protein product [Sphagnum jensenii]|uniref:Protein kinase domain-containing protein n=1 Tax=Sphagnum jensenii TaxID=128206 RepID=A0ABP1BE61_9BRYO
MDKCTRVSTAWLLIAVLGTMCNFSVREVSAKNPPGSFFVDCGSTASYKDEITGITWMPDDQFINENSGVNANASRASQYYPDFSEFTTFRYFPDSRTKNCYRFPVTLNATYQIRGTFFYGNQTTLPSFQMAVDGTIVGSDFIIEAPVFAYQEITYVAQTNLTYLCLSRDHTNSVPFISAISLVKITDPLTIPGSSFENVTTEATVNGTAEADNLYQRFYYMTQHKWNFNGGNKIIRYPDDPFDNYWFPIMPNSSYVNSSAQVEALSGSGLSWTQMFPPAAVMNTALTTNGDMTISIQFPHSYTWFMTLFLANLNPSEVPGEATILLEFDVEVPGYETNLVSLSTSANVPTVVELEYYGTVPDFVNLSKNSGSLLVNAMEIFEVSENQMAILTNQQDTLAIEEIKSSYGNLGVWTGDPCLPYPHPWLTCSNVSVLDDSSSIIAVNLSGYGLIGPISPGFTKLESLSSLNLDHNNFSGTLNLLVWNQQYFKHEKLVISMVNNDISDLEPSWENDTLFYSSLLLGGNPICNKLEINSNLTIAYHQKLNCRYNMSVLPLPYNMSVPPAPPVIIQRKNTKLIWILCTTLSIMFIFVGIICMVILRKYRMNALVLHEIQQEFARQQVQPTLYSYNVLKVATRDFHHDNKLGQGAFGTVYKGTLLDGTNLAIKLLNTQSHQNIDDFLNEVVSITGIKHKNLVKLKGCCLHGTQRLLVYELVEKKNLAEALWGIEGKSTIFLDWPTRFHICVGIARGLFYLHEELQPCIIHRDIKGPNILLDNNLNPKIADFGLARLFSNDQSHLFTQEKAGTLGYMSPEYATFGELSTKVDVYSFGVLLLEIISGRKAILESATDKVYLVKWAWLLHKENMLMNLVDQKINDTLVEIEVQRVINVALLCVQIEPTKRPSMSQVLAMLQGEMDLPTASSCQNLTNVSSIMDMSTKESTYLLSYPTTNNYNNVEVELTNLDPK